MPGRPAFAALVATFTVACAQGSQEKVYPVALAEGTYRVVFGQGYDAADEARLLAMTAVLDRASGRLVVTRADGSQETLVFSPRPVDRWHPDCFTMSSHASNEVADLSPAPLQVESLVFATPVVYAKCSPQRMILSNAPGEQAAFLALDLQ